jgi:L-threonylcarbamoyladenylate synthase
MIVSENLIMRDEILLEEILTCLRNGGVIVYPTETVYGIGGALSSQNATEKIFTLKDRERSRALLSITYDLRQAESFAQFRFGIEYGLFECFGAEGLTVILDARNFVSSRVRGGANTLGVRLASTELCRVFTERLAEPLSTTMANLSNRLIPDPTKGDVIPRKLSDVPEALIEQVDYAIDGGNLPEHFPSTILRVVEEGRIIIYREGVLKREAIEKEFGVKIEYAELPGEGGNVSLSHDR